MQNITMKKLAIGLAVIVLAFAILGFILPALIMLVKIALKIAVVIGILFALYAAFLWIDKRAQS